MIYMRKITPYNILKGIRYLKHFGPKEFMIRLRERMEPEEVPYGPWYGQYVPTQEELKRAEKTRIRDGVSFSVIVPLYRTPPGLLREMVDSVLASVYPDFELVLVNASPDDQNLAAALETYTGKAVKGREDKAGPAAGKKAGCAESSDSRIRVITLERNLGIAGNTQAGMDAARGDFLAFLDHDDTIDPAALYLMAKYVNEHPDTGLLYTDEDKISADGKTHFQPHLKPDYNPDLLKSNNYICHFLAVRRDVAKKAGGFDAAYEGAQDHDFIFRCIHAAKEMGLGVGHVPEILYHWRVSERSTADNPLSKKYAYSAGQAAIASQLAREGVRGEVLQRKEPGFYRVRYRVQGKPLVSIIIPNRDEKETLARCLTSIREKSTYTNYEIIIVENNSVTEEIRAYYREISADPRIRVLDFFKDAPPLPSDPQLSSSDPVPDAEDSTLSSEREEGSRIPQTVKDGSCPDGKEKKRAGKGPVSEAQKNAAWYGRRKGTVKVSPGRFNYSALNNFGFAHARGKYVILLNNDAEVITPDWIEELLGICQRPGTGAVGCKLLYPDGTIQHAGIVVGIGGIAGSMFVDMKKEYTGYMHKADLTQDLSAVTAACMMVRACAYRKVNGFEEKLTVAFNDVDFCLRLKEAGYLVVYDPYACLTHWESKTRGTENTKEKVRRFQSEIEYIRTKWTDILKEGDPNYNKNLSLSKWNYSLRDKAHMEL